MRNNLLWFHVITGHHADTRAEVCISLAWQAGAPSLPISPGNGLMGWLYCGPHRCWCLPLPAPVTTLFNKHEPIFGPRPSYMVPVSLSLACMGSPQHEWLNEICRTKRGRNRMPWAVMKHKLWHKSNWTNGWCMLDSLISAGLWRKQRQELLVAIMRSLVKRFSLSFLCFSWTLRFKHSTYHSHFLRFIASTSGLEAPHLNRSTTLQHALALLLSCLSVSLPLSLPFYLHAKLFLPS